jgi:hypothetical protein
MPSTNGVFSIQELPAETEDRIGNIITKSPTIPTASAANGVWTLNEQYTSKKAADWPS